MRMWTVFLPCAFICVLSVSASRVLAAIVGKHVEATIAAGWTFTGMFFYDSVSANDDADFDGDQDVDLDDYQDFQLCFGATPDPDCLCVFDVNEDGILDLVDLDAFVGALNGP